MIALVVACSWIVGIAVGQYVAPEIGWLAGLTGLVAGGASWLAGSNGARAAALGGCALFLGLSRSAAAGGVPDQLAGVSGAVMLLGRVGDVPAVVGQRMQFDLDIERIERNGEEPFSPVGGARVQIRAFGINVPTEYGDLVEVRARLVEPRSRPGYPLAELLVRRGITRIADANGIRIREHAGSSWTGALYRFRGRLETALRSSLPEPHASLAAGILLGTRTGTPAELRSALAATGTSHIVAVSGFNVAVMAGLVEIVAVRIFGRPWSLLPMLGAVWGFTVLVGAPPSALRAAAMISLVFAARAVGRMPDPIAVLAMAVAALLAWDPGLIGDLGFQLSAVATAGLILFAAPFSDRLAVLPRAVRDPLAVAVAAQVATLPIVLGTFHTLSLVAPLANLMVAPTIPAVMIFGGLLAVLEPLPGLGSMLAWATWGTLTYVLWAIESAAVLPAAVVFSGRVPAWFTTVWYVMLGLGVAWSSSEVQSRMMLRRIVRAGPAIVVLMALPASAVLAVQSDGRLEVSLLDVGAPAVFVRGPNGHSALLSGSSQSRPLVDSLARRLRFLERGPDLVIVGHSGDPARRALAEALRRYPAGVTLLPVAGGGKPADVPPPIGHAEAVAGQRVDFGGGAWIDVVDVRAHDEQTVVDARIVMGEHAVWLPGPGPASPRWGEVVEEGQRVLLRLPSSSSAWLRGAPAIPWLVIVSDAPIQPAPADAASNLDHRTHGAVEVVLDERGVELRTERCPAGRGCLVTR